MRKKIVVLFPTYLVFIFNLSIATTHIEIFQAKSFESIEIDKIYTKKLKIYRENVQIEFREENFSQ